MDYDVLKSMDQEKHKNQLINDLDSLRKKHEEMKKVLENEKIINRHYKDVVEVKDRTITQLSKLNYEFLIEIGKLRSTIKRLTVE
jgi:predicted glycosyltransferase|tara:strand:+ start:492 stop:746 length:255 start_codon:yes stop_codon:yes gene_type:complete